MPWFGAVDRDEAAHQALRLGPGAATRAPASRPGCGRRCRPALRAGVRRARPRRSGAGRARWRPSVWATPERFVVVRREIALVALVAQAPQLARRVAAVDEGTARASCILPYAGCRRSGTACRCCRAGRSPACVHGPRGAEADHRLPERGVDDHREAGRERRADRPPLLCAGLRRRPYDHADTTSAAPSGTHRAIPIVSPSVG